MTNKFAETSGRPRAVQTIVYGGLAIGILDGLFAFVFYGLNTGRQTNPHFSVGCGGLAGPVLIRRRLGHVRSWPTTSFPGCHLHRHRLLLRRAKASHPDPPRHRRRFSLRNDRVSRHELSGHPAITCRPPTVFLSLVSAGVYRTRFPGRVTGGANRAVVGSTPNKIAGRDVFGPSLPRKTLKFKCRSLWVGKGACPRSFSFSSRENSGGRPPSSPERLLSLSNLPSDGHSI